MNEKLGQLIVARREELGLQQQVLANKAGITPGYLCDIEHGRRIPSDDVLGRLADGLWLTLPDGIYYAAGRLPPRQRNKVRRLR
ncbi:MAG: helix-turn-helix transcriptional regulator [Dehalococcoidia bacterium]|nr:helix-turn-helix transcriptional regulator [Dehalococcoidia bacterium]